MTRRAPLLMLVSAAAMFAQPVPSYKDLKYPPLAQPKIPEPQTFTLSNGMRVFLLEDHELPLISGVAIVRTGNLFDPPDKKGLSQVTADVMRSGGTQSKTGDQIDEQLENVAGSVESGMDETSATVSFSALKESAGQVLDTFKDVLAHPEFRQDKIDLELDQLRSSIARRNDDAQAIPDRELLSIVYGRDTPYGWEIEYADLNHIKREDLIAFYQRYYFPKNIMLAVYGDFSSAEMKDRLEKLFADWKTEQPPVPAFPAMNARPAPGIYLAEKGDVTQTFFALGELGGTLRDKDYAALEVAANILGQGFTSRLMSQIRTRLGYAYAIQAEWAANYNHPGTLRIEGSTKSASTTETIEAIKAEVEKMRTSEVTERELAEAKDSVLNSFVFFFDSPAKTLNRVLRYEYFNYPKDFLFEYRKAVEAVTREDVLRVAKDHFRTDQLTIVAVGNPKDFGKPLTALGKVTPIDLTIPEPKQDTGRSDAASLAHGRELLQRAQQAMGGADKLAAIRDISEAVEFAMDASAGGIKMKQHNRYLLPSYFRQDLELPFGKISTYSDGKTGWQMTPQGQQPMPPQVVQQIRGVLFRNLPHAILADHDASLKVNAIAEDTVEISGDGHVLKLQFDASTGLPVKESYQEGPAAVDEVLLDWRDTGGVKLPYQKTVIQSGKHFADITIEEYQVNSGIKAEDLSRRP
ncbi:MAG TPA: pitrilysin family protein [Bryobacteraceae bacterium]|nr:pitrilysin family protein [Bryobacteraceae bacterium]